MPEPTCGAPGCAASAVYDVYLYQADWRGDGRVSFDPAVTPHLCHTHAMEELRYGVSLYSGGTVDRPAIYVPMQALVRQTPDARRQSPEGKPETQVETVEQEGEPTPVPQREIREKKGSRK